MKYPLQDGNAYYEAGMLNDAAMKYKKVSICHSSLVCLCPEGVGDGVHV